MERKHPLKGSFPVSCCFPPPDSGSAEAGDRQLTVGGRLELLTAVADGLTLEFAKRVTAERLPWGL